MNVAQHSVVFILRAYRLSVSPLLGALTGGGCRFSPSCSQYALEAVHRHGVIKGLVLVLMRLGRCHPWGGCGHDPVPLVWRLKRSFPMRRGGYSR